MNDALDPDTGLPPDVLASLMAQYQPSALGDAGTNPAYSAPEAPAEEVAAQMPSGPQNFWERLAAGGRALPMVQATSRTRGGGWGALYNLLAGYANAKAGGAAREMGQREQFNAQAQQAAALRNQRAWDAANKAQSERIGFLQRLSLAETAAKTKPPEPVTYLVKPGDVAKHPELASFVWQRMGMEDASRYGLVPPKPGSAAEASDLAPNLTPEGLDAVATLFAKTGQMVPMGMGKAGIKVREKIINRAAEIAPSLDIATNQADFRANQRSLAGLQANLDAITAFKNTALANTDIVLDRAKSIPDTGSPWGNQLARLVANKALGSADVTAFNAALQVARPEWSRILNNPTLSGVAITNEQRKDIQAVMGDNFTRKQLVSAAKVLHQDADNRSGYLKQQIEAIRQRIGRSIIGSSTVGDPFTKWRTPGQ